LDWNGLDGEDGALTTLAVVINRGGGGRGSGGDGREKKQFAWVLLIREGAARFVSVFVYREYLSFYVCIVYISNGV